MSTASALKVRDRLAELLLRLVQKDSFDRCQLIYEELRLATLIFASSFISHKFIPLVTGVPQVCLRIVESVASISFATIASLTVLTIVWTIGLRLAQKAIIEKRVRVPNLGYLKIVVSIDVREYLGVANEPLGD